MTERKLQYVELEPEASPSTEDADITSLVDQVFQAPSRRRSIQGVAEEGAGPGDQGEAVGIDPRDRPQLEALYRQLVYQYLDPMAQFIRMIRSGDRARKALKNFRALLDPVAQLTEAMEAREQAAIIRELAAHLERLMAHRGPFTYRHLEPLNVFFDNFLNSLGPEVRDKYLATCYYLRNSNPLLEEIRRVKYIGPRRLQRLYTVGLVTVEAISRSTPEEIREVTGISLGLAQQVIEVTKSYVKRERENRRQRLRGLCRDLATELSLLHKSDVDLYEDLNESFEALLPQVRRVRGWITSRSGKRT